MALINCPECKREVSDTVKNCPHCGFCIQDYMKGTDIILPNMQDMAPETPNESIPQGPLSLKQNKKSAPSRNIGLSIAAMVLGIIGLLLSCVGIGGILCVIGLILAIVAIATKSSGKGMAIAGLSTSIVGFLFFLIFIFSPGTTTKDDTKADISLEDPEDTNASFNLDNNQEDSSDIENETENNAQAPSTDTSNEDSTDTPEPPIESKEDYIASCQEYNYKDVLRYPENYIGQRVAVTVKISSVHNKGTLNPVKYYFGNTQDDTFEQWYGDKYGIFDYRDENDFKILEDDIIIVYGEISEPRETTSFIVNSEELFCIDMKYAELIEG